MLINTYTLEIKKSKFIAYYYSINNIDEVKIILDELKKNNKKASHFPYCFKLGNIIKKTDDKEPSNTAGMPIYNNIINNNLDNCLIVVIRYFGGTKLGAGPLLRAYNQSVIEVIKKSN